MKQIDTRRVYGEGIRVIDGAYTYTRGDGSITTVSMDNTTHEIQKYLSSHQYRTLTPSPTKRRSGGDPILNPVQLKVQRNGATIYSDSKQQSASTNLSVLKRPKDCGCGNKDVARIKICGSIIKSLVYPKCRILLGE